MPTRVFYSSFDMPNANAINVSVANTHIFINAGAGIGVTSSSGTYAGLETLATTTRVTVNGAIFGYDGIRSFGTVTQVFVAAAGTVSGDDSGIKFTEAGGLANNAGYVGGGYAGINVTAASNIFNTGQIMGGAYGMFINAATTLTNAGTISGGTGIYAAPSSAGQIITNTGTINGLNGPAVSFGLGNDSLTNTGSIIGNVNFAAGDDVYDGSGGRVLGKIDLGIGNDVATGGDRDDYFLANASDGFDVIYGGLGLDTYDASSETSFGLRVDLVAGLAQYPMTGTIDSIFSIERVVGTGASDVMRGANVAETLSGGGGNDTITARGGDDILYGGNGVDQLDGQDGNDVIAGGGGGDVMRGGAGMDVLISDAGKDTMTGGADADSFVFTGFLERTSGFGNYIADVITDFQVGSDKIDLSALDANDFDVGNPAFTWVGLGPATAQGQAGYSTAGGITRVWIFVETPLFFTPAQNTLLELTGTLALTANDFIL